MADLQEIPASLAVPERRLEGLLKVTGRARYTADVQPPGALWAKFVLSPFPHARIVRIDTTRALATPGVRAVLTASEIGERRFGRVLYDWPVLAWERVLFVGERVVAVAAESLEAAEEACRLVVVEYEELPAVLDPEQALREDAPLLHPRSEQYHHALGPRPPRPHPNLQGYRLVQRGDPDIERAFAQADLVVEDVYSIARQHQGYVEPRACVVWLERDGAVRVHSTNKCPFELQQQLSVVTGLPLDRIAVDGMFVGGDFGGKGLCIDEFACYYLAQASGRPVKSVMTYAEELGATSPRPSSRGYLRTGLTRDGRMVAHESRVYYDGGAYGAGRVQAGPLLDGWTALEPYRVPNARLETFLVYTNAVPGGQMRAPGAAHTGFVGESHVDHIARRLDLDPLEFRLRNAIREGDPTIVGERIRNPRAVEVLETLQRETGWGSRPPLPRRGRGIALRMRHIGEGKANVVLRLLPDGKIEAFHGIADQGGGAATMVQRVSAATLGVAPERVTARYGSTADAPVSPGPGASRTTHIVGQATVAAATELKRRLEELAAEAMGWPADAVRLGQDRFIVTDGSEGSASFEAVVARIPLRQPIEAHGAYDPAHHTHPDGRDFNFVALMVEVEVDPESGNVRPNEAVLVADVGAIINPISHRGQLEGGFVFGLGNALMEELRVERGRVTTLSLGEYKLPMPLDVPPLRIVLVPGAAGPGPFGAKSVGENVNNAVPPAVANAVRDAVGAHIASMPITAERVYEALCGSGRARLT